jgi:hypothetical protein
MICRAVSTPDDRTDRVRFGSALAQNPALTLSPTAARALRAGDVDPRVMLVLVELSSTHRLGVADFPAAELDAEGVPLRRVLLSTVDGAAASGDPLPDIRSRLGGQRPPLVPTLVEPAGDALLVGYPAPAPTGVLGS